MHSIYLKYLFLLHLSAHPMSDTGRTEIVEDIRQTVGVTLCGSQVNIRSTHCQYEPYDNRFYCEVYCRLGRQWYPVVCESTTPKKFEQYVCGVFGGELYP